MLTSNRKENDCGYLFRGDVLCEYLFFLSQQIPDMRGCEWMEMSNSSRNSHTEGVTHPPLVLGEKFFVEMQPELQDDLEMSYQECQANLWSLLQLKQKKL